MTLPRWVEPLLRGRWVTAALLAAVFAVILPAAPVDMMEFAAAGQRILDGHLDGVYDDGWNQAGPLQLVLSRVMMLGGAAATPALPIRIAVNVALVLGAMALCRRFSAGTGQEEAAGSGQKEAAGSGQGEAAGSGPRETTGSGLRGAVREAAAGLLGLLWLLVPVPWWGHPVELVIPALWAYASFLQGRGRTGTAAALLGVSVAVAPWAILGFPCLLAASGPVRALRTWVLAGLIGVAGYLPFVAAGHFGMFRHVWLVDPDSLVHLLLPDLATVSWPLRLVQAVVVAGGCAAVAWRFRAQRVVWAAAPATALLVRMFVDPVTLRYYWGPVAVASTLVFALVSAAERPHRQLLALLLGYLAVCAGLATRQVPGAAACLIVLIALLVAGVRKPSRSAAGVVELADAG
ncbi:hypothetical protein GCM10010168_74010 [Actinoplanes ianthinogenes]|uniref:Uncharacterized protein n=1 Tax=Actinoplanes ianthinogenes TaxID=122358 RepID=A0ABM7LMU2_9ACTN|nr:hypothetical protein [Actinoplanes ianthinogenes]BCJ40611.1 hypothetical protein Aiant_12680 [Actinoplanes ianthinogenes]GGR44119.1 hypothetical protein GCM10010168_74010 [Actinoplanes ianthinogenes]